MVANSLHTGGYGYRGKVSVRVTVESIVADGRHAFIDNDTRDVRLITIPWCAARIRIIGHCTGATDSEGAAVWFASQHPGYIGLMAFCAAVTTCYSLTPYGSRGRRCYRQQRHNQ